MASCRALAWLAVVWGMLVGLSAAGEVPEFTPKITDVTVFKDGQTLVMARGPAKLESGWCRTREVPVPILGAFWVFVADNDSEVDFVKAGMVPSEKTRPCLTLEEIIQANKGKRATIVEQPANATPVSHEGTLLGILQHEAERETVAPRTVPEERDRWGRSAAAAEVRETRRESVESLASFVMIETEAGVDMVRHANIRSIVVADKKPATTRTEKSETREIAVHVTSKGKPADGPREVGMVYLQRGIRWIPDYRIQLLDDGKAKVALQGTLINELADLTDADLRLVVGVPSFVMRDNISPLALREMGLQLSSYFAPPVRGGGRSVDYLSNVVMSQVAMPAEPRGRETAVGGPDIPTEGQQEDLFLYHKPHVTLKKGERATVKLLEVTVAYEDVYAWDVPPLPPREMWDQVGRDQQRQLASAFLGPKAMHKVRLTNSGTAPWTTAPATIFKGDTVLGQQLLTYTSVKNSVDVSITVATDVNTKKEEAEVRREPNVVINEHAHTKITLHGKLSVTNFKGKPIRVSVTRGAFGTVTAATADGKIVASNATEDTSLARDDYPWYSWAWPWWWYSVNPVSQITWEATIEKGKSATFEYDWYYYYRH